MVEWQGDPIGWISRYLGVPLRTLLWSMNPGYRFHPWDGTPDPLVQIGQSLAEWNDVAVESGTGTGKSFFAACLTLWFLACFPNARVYSYAPKEDQLRLYMWAEITDLWPRFKRLFPTAKLTDLRIRMDGSSDKWSAHGYSVQIRADEESATGAQGAHAPFMLLITEETPGIDPSVMTAIENTATADKNVRLALGNPDHQHDPLHEFAVTPGVVHVRMSALDHPNVVEDDPSIVPGAVSRSRIEARARKYGEQNRMYLSRVRGISPSEAVDAVIRQVWIDRAVIRWKEHAERDRLAALGGPGLGVDVANSEGGDEAAIARGRGAVLEEVSAFPCPNASHLGVRVLLEAKIMGADPRNVGIDSVGVGASTMNKLKELLFPARGLNAGEKPHPRVDRDVLAEKEVAVLEEEDFYNLRAQMWWQLRDDLQHGRIALPPDIVLHRELVIPTWETRSGKIIVEPKEKIRERLGRSPDRADAVVLWNWVRPRPELVQEEEEVSAWSAATLEREREWLYRVRDRDPRPPDFDPMAVAL